VSILLPAEPGGNAGPQARIRLKNHLREAKTRLGENRLSSDEVDEVLRPAQELLDHESRWRSLNGGLVSYLAPGVAVHFTVPAPVEAMLVVGSRFYLLPLLALSEDTGDFLVLALSMNDVRLFAADRFEVSEIELAGVPKSLTDAVGTDYEESSLQLHTVRPGSGGIMHGHGAGQGEETKEEATRFCMRVDAGLRRFLPQHGERPRPLVIAAAEPLASIYSRVTRYPNVASESVAGNPDHLSGEELRAQAWPILERTLERAVADELEGCRALLGTGRASIDVGEIVLASSEGRVAELFVARGAQCWGSVDLAARGVELGGEPAGAEELLNLAAGLTVNAGGTIRSVAREEVPEQADAAAIFRF
jgi:hypothetical protein